MVEVAPENEYFLYHQFGTWINPNTDSGTFIEHASVQTPFRGLSPEPSHKIWENINDRVNLPGDPHVVQSNSFQAPATGSAKLVFVVYDTSFWVHPEFTTEANRLRCQEGVLNALQRADGFLFISESAKRQFETILPGWLAGTGKRARVIPLASRFQPSGTRHSGANFWITVGSMEPRKNYETLFSAMELYWTRSANKFPLWIAAGKGWKSDDLRRKTQQLEAAGLVRHLGYVDDETLASLYQRALALVFPSWYEGFGLPVLEAMQCGCPIICSDTTSLPEIGGDVPIYVDPANPQSICEAMLQLEENPAQQEIARRAGIAQASKFTWRSAARQTLQFYRDIIVGQASGSIVG